MTPERVNPGGGDSHTGNPLAAAHNWTSSDESPVAIGTYSLSPLQLHTCQSSAISAYLFAFSLIFSEMSVTGMMKNSPYRLGSGCLSVFTIIQSRYALVNEDRFRPSVCRRNTSCLFDMRKRRFRLHADEPVLDAHPGFVALYVDYLRHSFTLSPLTSHGSARTGFPPSLLPPASVPFRRENPLPES